MSRPAITRADVSYGVSEKRRERERERRTFDFFCDGIIVKWRMEERKKSSCGLISDVV